MIKEYPFHYTSSNGTKVIVYDLSNGTFNFECNAPTGYFEFTWKTESPSKRTAIGFGDNADAMQILREYWAHIES